MNIVEEQSGFLDLIRTIEETNKTLKAMANAIMNQNDLIKEQNVKFDEMIGQLEKL